MSESQPRLRVKAELIHDRRNGDVSIDRLEERMERALNHPKDRVTNINISVGNKGSGVSIQLYREQWKSIDIDRIIHQLTMNMEYHQYADDIDSLDWAVDIVFPDGDQDE